MLRRRKFVSDPSIKLDPYVIVRYGDSNQLLKAIDDGANIHKVKCGSGWTLLHRAAEQGYSEICEILVQNGCNPNEKTTWGWLTPLHCALGNGWLETAYVLVKLGGHPWTKNKCGDDVVEHATKRGFADIAENFRKTIRKRERSKHLEMQLHFGVSAENVTNKKNEVKEELD